MKCLSREKVEVQTRKVCISASLEGCQLLRTCTLKKRLKWLFVPDYLWEVSIAAPPKYHVVKMRRTQLSTDQHQHRAFGFLAATLALSQWWSCFKDGDRIWTKTTQTKSVCNPHPWPSKALKSSNTKKWRAKHCSTCKFETATQVPSLATSRDYG